MFNIFGNVDTVKFFFQHGIFFFYNSLKTDFCLSQFISDTEGPLCSRFFNFSWKLFWCSFRPFGEFREIDEIRGVEHGL